MPAGTIDAHVHIGGRYGPVDAYVATMERLGLRHAVLVQYQWQADNTELVAAQHAHPGRFATIGVIDTAALDPVGDLRRWVDAGIQGIRSRPDARVPGRNPFALWTAAEERSLLVSVTGPPDAVTGLAFARLVRRFPGIRFRLEHLGGLGPRTLEPRTLRAFLRLADAPNVTTMLSGFWLNAGEPWPYAGALRLVRDVVDVFGAERICWSGDWNREGLTDVAYVAEAELLERSFGIAEPAARAAILGGTARRWFDFDRAAAG
jgi:predicted TIM-barrel fold metal-dependent hydrolase